MGRARADHATRRDPTAVLHGLLELDGHGWSETSGAGMAAKIRSIVAAGADPRAADRRGRTPLHILLGSDDDPSAVRALTRAGADPEARDADGMTALHRAAVWWRPSSCAALIAVGADAAAMDPRGLGAMGVLLCDETVWKPDPILWETLATLAAHPETCACATEDPLVVHRRLADVLSRRDVGLRRTLHRRVDALRWIVSGTADGQPSMPASWLAAMATGPAADPDQRMRLLAAVSAMPPSSAAGS